MKRVVALLLTIVLMLSLCGCTNKLEEAKLTAENFLNAFCELDSEKMAEFTDDFSKLPDDIKDFDIKKAIAELPEEFKAYSSDFEELFKIVIDNMKGYISYNIKESEKEDGEYVFKTDITLPDDDGVDFEKLITDKFDEQTLAGIMTEMFSSGEITTLSTEEEIIGAVMPKVFSLVEGVIKEVKWETKTEEAEIVVINKDGKWLVSAQKSDFED